MAESEAPAPARIAATSGTTAWSIKPAGRRCPRRPFQLLAPTGLLSRFSGRQRLIRTLATNLASPAELLTFAGAPVRAVIPSRIPAGNITITFGVL